MSIVTFGEVLIDFTPLKDLTEQTDNLTIESFQANPGGAPANLAAVLGQWGLETYFVGKVGKDKFGDHLIETLNNFNVNTMGVVKDDYYNTTLAFVHLDEDNDRSFSFFRNPGADTRLTIKEVDEEIIDQSTIFHFGSLSFTDEPIRSTTLDILEHLQQKDVLVSYDPNLREKLWKRIDEARWWMEKGLTYADIVKVSDEELVFLTGEEDLEKAASYLYETYNLKLLIVTLGPDGSFYRTLNKSGLIKGVEKEVVDTTGAGDVFYGALLHYLIEEEGLCYDCHFDQLDLDRALGFANMAGALSVTKKGAMTSIPPLEDVKSYI